MSTPMLSRKFFTSSGNSIFTFMLLHLLSCLSLGLTAFPFLASAERVSPAGSVLPNREVGQLLTFPLFGLSHAISPLYHRSTKSMNLDPSWTTTILRRG